MNTRNILQEAGCILEGDFFFALKSKRVAKKYINIDPLLTKPDMLDEVIRKMTAKVSLSSAVYPPEVVAGPAVGAIPLVYLFERHFPPRGCLQTVFAEKSSDGFVLERMGFRDAVSGKPVLVVEDITSTGESAKRTGEAIEAAGGHIVGYAFIWNRSPETVNSASMGATVLNLIEESVASFLPEEHPEWGALPLVTDIGHPEHFPDYPGPKIELLAK